MKRVPLPAAARARKLWLDAAMQAHASARPAVVAHSASGSARASAYRVPS